MLYASSLQLYWKWSPLHKFSKEFAKILNYLPLLLKFGNSYIQATPQSSEISKISFLRKLKQIYELVVVIFSKQTAIYYATSDFSSVEKLETSSWTEADLFSQTNKLCHL